jgi:hypothetical protein
MIEDQLLQKGFPARTLDYEPEELQENIQERRTPPETNSRK